MHAAATDAHSSEVQDVPSDIAEALNATRWGVDFDPEDIERIANFFEIRSYVAGQYVFKEGEQSDFVAYILEGEVAIVKNAGTPAQNVLVALQPKSHFGELSFIDSDPRSASAMARAPSRLLILSKQSFDYIVAHYPSVAVKILVNVARIISNRLRMTTGRLYCPPFFRSSLPEWSGM